MIIIVAMSIYVPSENWLGYDTSISFSATWLSLKLLAIALLWTIILHSFAISLCFISIRWKEEIGESLEIFFQIISCIPLFILCLLLQHWGKASSLIWAGLALASGDFLLAAIFPMLRWNLLRYFNNSYREALRGRGIVFPIPELSFSKEHWRLFFRYYVLPYWAEFFRTLQNKIPLFFSALIIIEKALFYGTNIVGANRGLGSLFFDCILEWSEGKPRLIILFRLSFWCLFLVTATRFLFHWLSKKIHPKYLS